MVKFLKVLLTVILTFVAIRGVSQNSPTVEESAGRGKGIYEQNCLACHQADGSGVPNLAPPLARGMFVGGDKTKVIRIVVEGMQGVEINGEYYANPMPAFGYLTDQEVADVLTYVRRSFSNNASAVTSDEVKEARGNESSK